jgi:hypothetical protein
MSYLSNTPGNGIAIGDEVLGGNPGSVLYIDTFGNLTDDTEFTRDPNDNYFTKLLADTQAFLVIDEGNGSSYQAVNHGAIGNTITLVFNGTDDIDTVVAAWNAANPSNQVALISGLGTEVLSANTYTLSGGGVTGLQVGHHDIFGAQLDGTATYAIDQTSGAFAGSLFGDASALGIPGLSGIFGYTDFAGHNFAAIIANPEALSLNYSSPAGQASLQLDSKEASISSGNKWGFQMSDNNSEIGWFTPSYTLKLPTTTPNVGDSIQVTSSGGGNYYTSWATGGGGAAGSDTWVQFNNAGVLGASQDFTWDDTSKSLDVGGVYDQNKTIFRVNNSGGYTQFLMGTSNSSFLKVKDRASGYDVLSIQADIFSGEFGSINGFAPNANSVYFGVNNPGKQLTGYGLSKPVQTPVTFSGSGLNDMTPSAAAFYTGNNSTNTFSATVTHVNVQSLNITSVAGGTPTAGDVVTGLTSGATGTIFQTDSSSYMVVENITGGTFIGTEVLNAVSPATWTAATVASFALSDWVFVSNGPNSQEKPMFDTMSTIQGVTPTFASNTGHTLGDIWGWDYGVQYGAMFNLDGNSVTPTVTIGDVNGLYGGGNEITMNLIAGFTRYGGGKVNQTQYVATASYNIKQSDYNVDVRLNIIGAAPDVYLPTIDFQGREYVITDEDGNSALYPITIHAASGQVFNTTGTSTLVINTNFQSVRIHANVSGNVWIVTSN